MKRIPVMPLVERGLDIAEQYLGPAELARRLGVSQDTIGEWRANRADMPPAVFLKLVDVLVELHPAWSEKHTLH